MSRIQSFSLIKMLEYGTAIFKFLKQKVITMHVLRLGQ